MLRRVSLAVFYLLCVVGLPVVYLLRRVCISVYMLRIVSLAVCYLLRRVGLPIVYLLRRACISV